MLKNNCGLVCLHYRKPVITNITHINSFKHHRNNNMSRVAQNHWTVHNSKFDFVVMK